MKISATAGFAMIVGAGIALAIYWHWPVPAASSTLVAQPDAPRAAADAPMVAAPRTADTLSIADLTRLTIQSLSSPDAAVREQAVTRLLPELAQRDAVAAARVADLFAESPLRPRILSAVARGWVARNRQHALDWAQGLGDEGEREAVLVEIFSLIAQTDPAEAVRLRQQMTPGPADDAELTNLAQRWAETDLASVLGWTDSLPPGAQRDQLIARAAFIQSQSSPAEAAQLVMDRIPQGEAQSEALISVVHQWARRDYDAAAAWVERLPAPVLRERAALELEAVRRGRDTPR